MGETIFGGNAVSSLWNNLERLGLDLTQISKTKMAKLSKISGGVIAKGAVDDHLQVRGLHRFTNQDKELFQFHVVFLGLRTESPLSRLPVAKISRSAKPIPTQAREDARDLLRATFQKSLAHTSLAQGMNLFLRSNEMKKVVDVNGAALEEIGEEGRTVVRYGLKVTREVVIFAA